MFNLSPELQTGLSKIDSEHKHIFNIINLINSAISKNQHQFITDKLLSQVYEFTKRHFEHEEDIMALANYNGLNHHLEKHSIMLNTMREKIDHHATTGNIGPTLSYLTESLSNHMKEEDLLLADFIRQKRRKNIRISQSQSR